MQNILEIPEGYQAKVEQVNNKIIIDYYKEIKNGSFITTDYQDKPLVRLVKNYDIYNGIIQLHAHIGMNGQLFYNDHCNAKVEYKASTEEEKQLLLDALRKDGKDWDAEIKQIVKYRWKPKLKEIYFTIDFDHTPWKVFTMTWSNSWYDKTRFSPGLVFKSITEAQMAIKRMLEIL